MPKVEVFLDLDGVLVDFVNGACKLHGVNNPYLSVDNLGKYEICDLIDIPPSKFFASMGHDFWANLEWLPDGKEIIDAILKYVKPEQVTLLTSPIKTLGCTSGKMDWIEKNVPKWRRSFLIGPGKHKIAGPGKLLIDDYDKNVDEWVTHGGRAIQVPRAMNRLHSVPTMDFVRFQLELYFANNHD